MFLKYLNLLLPPLDADVVEDGPDDGVFGAFVLGLRVFSMGYFFLIIPKMFSVDIVLILESLVLNSALPWSRASL
jgi:hypothetical protein